ncbi:unnamed protein product [Phaeothamnion confervicola]
MANRGPPRAHASYLSVPYGAISESEGNMSYSSRERGGSPHEAVAAAGVATASAIDRTKRRWQRPAIAAAAVLGWAGMMVALSATGGGKGASASAGAAQSGTTKLAAVATAAAMATTGTAAAETLAGQTTMKTTTPRERWEALKGELTSGGSDAGDLRAELAGAYPPLQSLSLYGFANVVEPHRSTALRALGGGDTSTFEWTVYTQDGEIDAKYSGREVSHVFTHVTESYGVALAEVSTGGVVVRTHTTSAMCKYIRRDTHRMNEEDRQRTLAAMRVMYDVSGEDGRALYGPKYVSFEEMTVLHLDRYTQLKCTPWHNACVFLTAHAAMSLQVEQSMQAIDPAVAMPYFDLTYEASLGQEWRSSEMFTDKWFGSWGAEENDYRVVDSVFANLSIYSDCSKPEKNAYCRLTNGYNNDPSQFLTRSDQICGMRTTSSVTTCSLIESVMEQTSYVDFQTLINENIHKYLHGQLGGMWGCPFEVGTAMALAPDSASYQLFLEGAIVVTGSASMLELVEDMLIQCPDSCGEEVPFDQCLCYCPDIHRLVTEGRSLYEASLWLLTEASLDSTSMWEVLDGMSTEAAEAFVIWYAGYVCSPGRLPPYASPLGAPNDPLFAPTHTYFDYLVQAKMIQDTDFEVNWDNDNACWAHAFLAHLPWHDFEDEHNQFYTNQELQRFFRPNNPSLPYVYDDYSFERCKVEGPSKVV